MSTRRMYGLRGYLAAAGIALLGAGGAGAAAAQAAPDTAAAPVDTLAVLLKGSLYVHELTPGAAPPARAPETNAAPDTTESLPEAARALLTMLNVKDADLRDVFRTIAHEHSINLMVDNRIERRVTVRLAALPVIEALRFLCMQNGLALSRTGHIFRIAPKPEPPPVPEPPPRVAVREGLLTVDLRGDDLERVVRLVAQQSGQNIIVRRGVGGTLTGSLRGIPLEEGLRALAATNGFAIRRIDGIYHIDRLGMDAEGGPAARAFFVEARDSLIHLDVVDAPIAHILREIAAQTDADLITYDTPEERITAKADSLTLEAALDLLLRRTRATYRREGARYFIGDRETSGIADTRLIRLHHLRAEAALDLLPPRIREHATLQVVREHNGLMVTGTRDVIVEVEHIVREVDHPTPQILIEALVVDFEANDLFEFGLGFGRNREEALAARREGYRFEGGATEDAAGLQIGGNGHQVNDFLRDYVDPLTNGLFGVRTVGRLPSDFFLHIRALSAEGRATIRSRPQIATLNGHTASLKIGTTQYYILRTQTPYQNPNQVLLQNTQRFEKIEANVVLDITPWVSASGEITADIRPEFSMPVGEFDPDVPPTINTRVLESTVRLRDGETIILGGLIQDEERALHNKVPVLGSIPLLGRLFRSTTRDKVKSELVIFLTPHVFYGDARDEAKWQRLREAMDLKGLDDRSTAQKLRDRLR
ncbi:MAG: type II and III secretion system protein [Rhodothermales bacterium]|nr:type II and III secretion system protein [Rhodothermales bacterium]